jgi:hypothetical protein
MARDPEGSPSRAVVTKPIVAGRGGVAMEPDVEVAIGLSTQCGEWHLLLLGRMCRHSLYIVLRGTPSPGEKFLVLSRLRASIFAKVIIP